MEFDAGARPDSPDGIRTEDDGATRLTRRQFLLASGAVGVLSFLPGVTGSSMIPRAHASHGSSFDFPVLTDERLEAGFETGSMDSLRQVEKRGSHATVIRYSKRPCRTTGLSIPIP